MHEPDFKVYPALHAEHLFGLGLMQELHLDEQAKHFSFFK